MKSLKIISIAVIVSIALLAIPVNVSTRSFENLFGKVSAQSPVFGAIYTTNLDCNGVNVNVYTNILDVYLNGGPNSPNANGLTDGIYYVQVTDPDGTVLGTSVGSSNETPVTVVNGNFEACYHLWDILIKASDGTQGYDETSNDGGEYKVWISTGPDFSNEDTKTDNYKVLTNRQSPEPSTSPEPSNSPEPSVEPSSTPSPSDNPDDNDDNNSSSSSSDSKNEGQILAASTFADAGVADTLLINLAGLLGTGMVGFGIKKKQS